MLNPVQIRNLIAYGVALPLVVVVGYFISQTDDFFSLLALGLVLLAGCLPFLLNSHRLLLILSWNAAVDAFFLPGQPALWIVLAFVSLFFSIAQSALKRNARFITVPFLTWPLVILGIIVVITAIARGGIGLRSFGSDMIGGKKYVTVMGAIVGYFALSCQAIPKKRAVLYATLFFLMGTTAAICDLIYVGGPGFYWLYYAFPPELARLQAMSDYLGPQSVFRLEGVAWSSVAFCCFMLVRFGARGVLDFRRPWRIIIFLLAVVAGLFGGFRSRLFLIGMFFIAQFCLEGLWKTRWLPILLAGSLLIGAVVLSVAEKLPNSVQRTLSFLPVKVDPSVKKDAEDSTLWRLEMWGVIWPEVPRYLWLGKGYTFSASDFYLTEMAQAWGLAKDYESMVVVAEYHNGWFSAMIPLGIWGLVAFVWFVAAGWWALYQNYRYGDKDLQRVNTFFLAFYTVRTIFFFTIYGSLNPELALFTGVLGLSVAINQGVKKRPVSSRAVLIEPALQTA